MASGTLRWRLRIALHVLARASGIVAVTGSTLPGLVAVITVTAVPSRRLYWPGSRSRWLVVAVPDDTLGEPAALGMLGLPQPFQLVTADAVVGGQGVDDFEDVRQLLRCVLAVGVTQLASLFGQLVEQGLPVLLSPGSAGNRDTAFAADNRGDLVANRACSLSWLPVAAQVALE